MRRCGCVSIFSVLLLAGCVTVPPLEEDGIAIGDIVQRVKCEIAFAVPEPRPPYPTGRYQWMRNWTAKIDLTLTTNARSTITPTSVFSSVAPDLTLGVGASLDTQAERTEVLSFSLSFVEMLQFRKRAECNLHKAHGVYGHLGLREWIDSALAPVDAGKLSVGRHPRLGGKSPPAPPVLVRLDRGLDRLAELKQASGNVVHYAKAAQDALDKARDDGPRERTQATYDDASIVYGALAKAAPDRSKVKTLVPKLLHSEPDFKKDIQDLQEAATDAGNRIDAAKLEVDEIIKRLPLDPPIDSLSHSLRFVVALGGNLSPNWTLVGFRGPSASGSLLSGSRTRTHTLNIVMGTPEEQSRLLTNLVIIQNLRPNQ